jgi:hypothetical protein
VTIPSQIIGFSKPKLCRQLVVGIAAIAAGIWMALTRVRGWNPWMDAAVGMVCIAFGAALLLDAVRRLFGGAPALLFDQEGIIENTYYGSVGRILWSDITCAEVVENFVGAILFFSLKRKDVVIGVHRPEEFAARVAARESRLLRFLRRAKLIWSARPIRVPTVTIDMTADELADLINRWIAQMRATPALGSGNGRKF